MMASTDEEQAEGSAACFWCRRPCDCRNACDKCGLHYCSPKHFALHRKEGGEEEECFPFRIGHSEASGRYMEATRPIKAHEVILLDSPLVVGPSRHPGDIVCVACFVPQTACDKLLRCSQCRFPLCGRCPPDKLAWHKELECPRISCRASDDDVNGLVQQIAALVVYRYLILQRLREFPVTFARPREIRATTSDLATVRIIRDVFGHAELEPEEIISAIRVLHCNAKTLEVSSGTGLYPKYSLMNHACVCNTQCFVSRDDFGLELRATVDIAEGEEISTRYICFNTEQPTRSLRLWDHWAFVCRCSRCSDPTELESFNSGVKCFGSTSCVGYLLPTDPGATNWTCGVCGFGVGRAKIYEVVERARQYIRYSRHSLLLAGIRHN